LVAAKQGRRPHQVAVFWRACNHLVREPQSAATTRRRTAVIGNASLQNQKIIFSPGGNAMDALWNMIVAVGQAIEAVLIYVETHHWIFAFLAGGYIFYLHDRGLHARFDALDKRVDEIRKRLAIDY
jgi:hypothetical protein